VKRLGDFGSGSPRSTAQSQGQVMTGLAPILELESPPHHSRAVELDRMQQMAAMMSCDARQVPAAGAQQPPGAFAAAAIAKAFQPKEPSGAEPSLPMLPGVDQAMTQMMAQMIAQMEQQLEKSLQAFVQTTIAPALYEMKTQRQEWRDPQCSSIMQEVSTVLEAAKVSMHEQLSNEMRLVERWRSEAALDIGNLVEDLNNAREDVAGQMAEVRDTACRLQQAEQHFDEQTRELRAERFAWISAREMSDYSRADVTRKLQVLTSALESDPSPFQAGRLAAIATSMVTLCSEISNQLNELEGRVTAGVASTEARIDMMVEDRLSKQVNQGKDMRCESPPTSPVAIQARQDEANLDEAIGYMQDEIKLATKGEAAQMATAAIEEAIEIGPRVTQLEQAMARMTAILQEAPEQKEALPKEEKLIPERNISEISLRSASARSQKTNTASEKSNLDTTRTLDRELSTGTNHTLEPPVAEKWVQQSANPSKVAVRQPSSPVRQTSSPARGPPPVATSRTVSPVRDTAQASPQPFGRTHESRSWSIRASLEGKVSLPGMTSVEGGFTGRGSIRNSPFVAATQSSARVAPPERPHPISTPAATIPTCLLAMSSTRAASPERPQAISTTGAASPTCLNPPVMSPKAGQHSRLSSTYRPGSLGAPPSQGGSLSGPSGAVAAGRLVHGGSVNAPSGMGGAGSLVGPLGGQSGSMSIPSAGIVVKPPAAGNMQAHQASSPTSQTQYRPVAGSHMQVVANHGVNRMSSQPVSRLSSQPIYRGP